MSRLVGRHILGKTPQKVWRRSKVGDNEIAVRTNLRSPSDLYAQRLLPVSLAGTVISSFGITVGLPMNGNSVPK